LELIHQNRGFGDWWVSTQIIASTIKVATETLLLSFIDFFRLYTSNIMQKLQKKKSVSNGNELKKCMQHGNDG